MRRSEEFVLSLQVGVLVLSRFKCSNGVELNFLCHRDGLLFLEGLALMRIVSRPLACARRVRAEEIPANAKELGFLLGSEWRLNRTLKLFFH